MRVREKQKDLSEEVYERSAKKLYSWVKSDNTKAVECYFKNNPAEITHCGRLLSLAVKNQSLEMVKLLIEKAKAFNTNTLVMLVSYGQNAALLVAYRFLSEENKKAQQIKKILIEHGAMPNFNILISMIKRGNLCAIKDILLLNSELLTIRDREGENALSIACKETYENIEQVVECLLANHAELPQTENNCDSLLVVLLNVSPTIQNLLLIYGLGIGKSFYNEKLDKNALDKITSGRLFFNSYVMRLNGKAGAEYTPCRLNFKNAITNLAELQQVSDFSILQNLIRYGKVIELKLRNCREPVEEKLLEIFSALPQDLNIKLGEISQLFSKASYVINHARNEDYNKRYNELSEKYVFFLKNIIFHKKHSSREQYELVQELKFLLADISNLILNPEAFLKIEKEVRENERFFIDESKQMLAINEIFINEFKRTLHPYFSLEAELKNKNYSSCITFKEKMFELHRLLNNCQKLITQINHILDRVVVNEKTDWKKELGKKLDRLSIDLEQLKSVGVMKPIADIKKCVALEEEGRKVEAKKLEKERIEKNKASISDALNNAKEKIQSLEANIAAISALTQDLVSAKVEKYANQIATLSSKLNHSCKFYEEYYSKWTTVKDSDNNDDVNALFTLIKELNNSLDLNGADFFKKLQTEISKNLSSHPRKQRASEKKTAAINARRQKRYEFKAAVKSQAKHAKTEKKPDKLAPLSVASKTATPPKVKKAALLPEPKTYSAKSSMQIKFFPANTAAITPVAASTMKSRLATATAESKTKSKPIRAKDLQSMFKTFNYYDKKFFKERGAFSLLPFFSENAVNFSNLASEPLEYSFEILREIQSFICLQAKDSTKVTLINFNNWKNAKTEGEYQYENVVHFIQSLAARVGESDSSYQEYQQIFAKIPLRGVIKNSSLICFLNEFTELDRKLAQQQHSVLFKRIEG